MKIVIDSNVWISALVFGGKPRHIFERVITDGWTIVASEEIFTEVRRVLNAKFVDFLDNFESFQAILQPYTTKVKLGRIKVSICRDEDDNRVVETALIGHATHVITGDKDLLVLSKYKKITILAPSEFIDIV